MAGVSLSKVVVLNNPAAFSAPFQFEITFECLQQLQEDIEWRLIYVGSAESEVHDQELDCVLVGPVPVGFNKFVFEADAPDPTKIPPNELLGVTVVLLTCSYNGNEFVRVGYYVNNDYEDEEMKENPPEVVNIPRVQRSILDSKPRVTRYQVPWDNVAPPPPPCNPDGSVAGVGGVGGAVMFSAGGVGGVGGMGGVGTAMGIPLQGVAGCVAGAGMQPGALMPGPVASLMGSGVMDTGSNLSADMYGEGSAVEMMEEEDVGMQVDD